MMSNMSVTMGLRGQKNVRARSGATPQYLCVSGAGELKANGTYEWVANETWRFVYDEAHSYELRGKRGGWELWVPVYGDYLIFYVAARGSDPVELYPPPTAIWELTNEPSAREPAPTVASGQCKT